MAEKFWINSDNTLFVAVDGQPRCLPQVAILKVEWLIGDPRKGAKATIVLHSQMPAGGDLLDLRNGVTLEVLHHEYGIRSEYVAKWAIAKFANCEILNWWIDNLVVTYMDLSEVVTLFVRVQADFEILEPE